MTLRTELKFNTNFLHGIVTFLHATLNEMNAQIHFPHVTRTFLHATFQKIIAILLPNMEP